MGKVEHKKILELQMRGFGYKKIAVLLDLPVNSVKSFCRRHPLPNCIDEVCLNCKKEIIQTPHKRKKKFCSDKCRYAWWSKNVGGNKAVHICDACGKEFYSYKSKKRKYCSRKCYDKKRGVLDYE